MAAILLTLGTTLTRARNCPPQTTNNPVGEVERIFEAFFQIQPARPVPLVFERAIAYFSEPVEEDRSRQPISSLTFIKACSHAPTQGWVFKPCEHEERPLDSTGLGSTGDEQRNAVYHAEAPTQVQ
jgi:hypothetical protein